MALNAIKTTTGIVNSIKSDDLDLFISYQWCIQCDVAKLHEKLELTSPRLRVWRDSAIKHNNEGLCEQLGKRIVASKIFLCLLTKEYVKSNNCLKEINFAARLGKTIIYLMIEKMNAVEIGPIVGFIMGNSVYIHCYKHAKSWWQDDFEDIKKSVEDELKVRFYSFSNNESNR